MRKENRKMLSPLSSFLTLLHFKSRRVDFVVCFVVLYIFAMINSLMWAIALYAFCPLNSVYAYRVALLLAILALGNTWVHICISNCSNKSSNVKSSVNKGFGLGTTLSIPNINPDYYHIWLWRHLNDSGFQYQNNIVKKCGCSWEFFQHCLI